MKIIKPGEVLYNNIIYKRTLSIGKCCWWWDETSPNFSILFSNMLEEKYKICLREYKLKNILDENY